MRTPVSGKYINGCSKWHLSAACLYTKLSFFDAFCMLERIMAKVKLKKRKENVNY